MDPQTTSPATPEALSLTLHNATIEKAERNDISNTARSNPLQRTRTLVLQSSLTPDDVYTHVLATTPLPRELVEGILLLLDTKSTLKCRLVNRQFNAIIQSSTLVQYHLACNAADVIDNPQSPLSYAERLKALKKREDAWRKLKPAFEMSIDVNFQSSSSHELTAGNYFLSDENGTDLYCCHLPSSSQDNPQWRRIPGHGPGQSSGFIVDMGIAVNEHDLVVKVISSEVGNQADSEQHSLDLVLLKFSTGEYHPLARHPLIHVQRSASAQPYAIVRIVGDSLALVVHDEDVSQLFIFDWKTGHKRLQHEAIEDAYENTIPVFVSPELLLLPNHILFHFEVWHLFPSHPNANSPVQILSLQIPAVSDDYAINNIRCHGELSPFLDSMPYFQPRPFFPSSENSIIIVSLIIGSRTRFKAGIYRLVLHRRSLLDMIQKWTSPSLPEQQGDLPTWFMNEVTVHEVTDPDDGSVRLGAYSYPTGVWTSPHPGSSPRTRDSPTLATCQTSPTSSTSHISADSSSSSISQVQWADWGPPISRWFHDKSLAWWVHQAIGQRYVFLDPDLRDERKWTVAVADFNVRRNAEMMTQLRREADDNGGNGNSRDFGEGKTAGNEEEWEMLDHKGMFAEKVYMGLNCVVYHAPGEYDFDVVLMDEERLLGLTTDVMGRVESVKVLYLG